MKWAKGSQVQMSSYKVHESWARRRGRQRRGRQRRPRGSWRDRNSSRHKKKILWPRVTMGVSPIYHGDHFAIYANIESCPTPETNTLCQL